jgi:L-alanine-DL-glutamate epimerase-like enolase superfamily enzyme
LTISRIEVHVYSLTYVHGSYVMSGGRAVDELESIVVGVTTDDGVRGFGETCPLGPAYLPAHAGGAVAALKELAPALVGVDACNLGEVNRAMDAALAGHAYAKSAVDIACWDVLGRTTGTSVSTLLGGTRSQRFPLYRAVPLGDAGEMAAYVEARRAEGIRRFQLKLGGEPRADAARVARVLEATGSDELVIADANGGWRLQDAVVAARLLDRFERVFLEQPCPTLAECLAVRRRTTLPMILDEVVFDVDSLLAAQRGGGMEAINLKLAKFGGLTKGKLIRDLAEALGLRLTIEDTWGGDVTTAAVSHLAASTAPDTLFTVSFMNDWTNEHVAGHVPRSTGGFGSAPGGPGLGIDVDVERLGAPVLVAA